MFCSDFYEVGTNHGEYGKHNEDYKMTGFLKPN